MSFGYFGAKHGLARFYPEPRHDIIVEPFAGAAGYSCYWAQRKSIRKVVLIDLNPGLVDLWSRLIAGDRSLLYDEVVKGEYTTNPLIASASGEQGLATLRGKKRKITDRMVSSWPRTKEKIERLIPVIKSWEIRLGDYRVADDIEATWFVDPPYTSKTGWNGSPTAGGHSYKDEGKIDSNLDYNGLGLWVRGRKGQVIACEQEPADWLPFKPFRRQRNGVGAGTGSTRTELVYIGDEHGH